MNVEEQYEGCEEQHNERKDVKGGTRGSRREKTTHTTIASMKRREHEKTAGEREGGRGDEKMEQGLMR